MTTTTTYLVDGLTCGHCVASVNSELRGLDGVTSVDVDLKVGASSPVTVVSAQPLDEAAVRATLDEAGYDLAGVE